MKIAAIIPAAGRGSRLKAKTPKPLVLIGGKPLLVHTLGNLKKSYPFFEMILAVDPVYRERIQTLVRHYRIGPVRIVSGGSTRAESVRNALRAVSKDCDWVLIHDAARPLVNEALVRRTVQRAKKTGAALCALGATATVKRVDRKRMLVIGTEDGKSLYLAQTPQVFKKSLLESNYQKLGDKALTLTDDAAFFDGTSVHVAVVQGDPRNIKITTPEDVELFKYLFKKNNDKHNRV